jgi:hypothetical protein
MGDSYFIPVRSVDYLSVGIAVSESHKREVVLIIKKCRLVSYPRQLCCKFVYHTISKTLNSVLEFQNYNHILP